jgi:hypothetical protein
MTTFRPYPLFAPPTEVADRSPRDWSPRLAHIYFEWLTGVATERTRDLLGFFDLDRSDLPPRDLLLVVGEHLAEELRSDGGSARRPGGERILTSRGHALAADAGLLTAHLIIDVFGGDVHWHIVDRPRTDRSFNLPALVGFVDDLHLDPIAASIDEANGIIAGRRGPDAWAHLFDVWSDAHRV